MALNRSQILQAPDIQREEIEVPEWGGTVIVRGLSAAARDKYEDWITTKKNGRPDSIIALNMRAKFVALSCVDENDELLFSEDDVKELGKKSARAMQRIFDTAARLSGLSTGDVEELEKNLPSGQSNDSGTS